MDLNLFLGKKRKAKESKKSNKKKKKRKNDSDSDAEFEQEPELEPVPSKGRKGKGGAKAEQNEESSEDMPTVSDVCENFGLADVDLEYSDADYQNLTTYKLFQQTYRQRIQGANPKVRNNVQ